MSALADDFHEISDAEMDALWPAVKAAHLLDGRESLERWRDREPWSVRMTHNGEAVLLQRWREHLDICHIRMAWCAPRRIGAMIRDVRSAAREHGLPRLLSPLLDDVSIAPYVEAGLDRTFGLVAYTWIPASIGAATPPVGVRLRAAVSSDLPSLAELEAVSFSEFWRHVPGELSRHTHVGRCVVAEENGEVVGYTLTTSSRDAATLARVAVHPRVQRRGVGRALVAEASAYAAKAGAISMSLCTQESNEASRALYASLGLEELTGSLVFAADPSVCF